MKTFLLYAFFLAALIGALWIDGNILPLTPAEVRVLEP